MYPKSLLSRRTRATNRIRAIPARAQWWQSIVLTHRVRVHCGLDRLHTLGLLRSGNLVGRNPIRLRNTATVWQRTFSTWIGSGFLIQETVFAAKLGRYIAAEHITAINKLGEYAWPDWQCTREERFAPTISRKTA
jgi:hypothetical protein